MVNALLEEGIRAHDQGDRPEAAVLYRQVLERKPGNSDAIYLLGVIDYQEGRLDAARKAIHRAIRISPKVPYYYYYLGLVEKETGNLDLAVRYWKKGVKLNGKLAPFYEELAKASLEHDDAEGALAWTRRGRRIAPDNLKLMNYKAIALYETGAYDAARDLYGKIIKEEWEYPEVWNNLGNCHYVEERWSEATDAYRQAIAIEPQFAEAWSNLGDALRRQNRLAEGMAALERATAIDPACSNAWHNRGTILQIRGEMRGAERAYLRALELDPANPILFSNYLFSTLYREEVSADEIYARHRAYGERIEAAFEPARRPRTPPFPGDGRKLRIGLVSADFKWHSVGYFLAPFLEHYDRSRFEITAYSGVRKPDSRTEVFRECVDRWRAVHGLSDEAMASCILRDRIDVLVDLSGHTESNRLPVFARQPAPVQVSWLGYPASTGLTRIHYRLTDSITEPPESAVFSSEALYPLEDGFHCFRPHPCCPVPSAPPFERNGYITFGSYNYLAKVTPGVIATWADILDALPDALLVLKSHILEDETVRDRYRRSFRDQGADLKRVRFEGFRPSVEAHLASYGEIDIALDPFPYNGTTTSCEAMWMGVPVVVLAGARHAARVGMSLVTRAGHPEWVAFDRAAYVAIATTLAADRERLGHLRKTLRDEMAGSPLRDETGFTRKLESAFQAIFMESHDA